MFMWSSLEKDTPVSVCRVLPYCTPPLGRRHCSISIPFCEQYALPRHKLRSPARQEVVGAVEKKGGATQGGCGNSTKKV